MELKQEEAHCQTQVFLINIRRLDQAAQVERLEHDVVRVQHLQRTLVLRQHFEKDEDTVDSELAVLYQCVRAEMLMRCHAVVKTLLAAV